MTTEWSSYRGVPLQGHLYVADQQKKNNFSKSSQMNFYGNGDGTGKRLSRMADAMENPRSL